MAPKSKPLSPELQQDVDFLGTLLAKGISGLIEFSLSDGLKMKASMSRIAKNKVSTELAAKMWEKFFIVNPHASAAIELAAAASPKLREFLERIRVKPKDVPPEDVTVHDAEVM